MGDEGEVVNADEDFTKRRYLWQPAAWRLVREATCADYARKVVPTTVRGIRIEFPETRVRLGPRVTVTSRALTGESLLNLLYRPALHEAVVALGLAALEAWQCAAVTGRPFGLFSFAYKRLKGPLAMFAARCEPGLLSAVQRQALGHLLARYTRSAEDRRFLAHGDFHPSHVVVDLAGSSLGFLDLEAMHVGKAATNFAQLWTGYHYAAPELGQALYQAYRARFPEMLTAQFDNDVRAELALRCLTHIRAGQRMGNRELEGQARAVLAAVLSGPSFETLCLKGIHL